ncbi:DUF2515 family protein [Metabacillus fastidiosus]|uniref:DUF2515 family protein n=1 Tax=Metabacillus fastidiosus TaxID=1458 RepID=UPI00399C7233
MKTSIFLSSEPEQFISYINNTTEKENYDNISRTKAYAAYFDRNREIMWPLLASLVSRNAGWSMTDLQGKWFRKALSFEQRHILFMLYEKANWMIFSDAFPQLLVYEYSKYHNKPYFYLLEYFSISRFMINEWSYFWQKRDKHRLVTSLIINEQNVIQQPIIENKQFEKKIFKSMPYFAQEILHFNTVLFPTLNGQLFGFSVVNFQNLTKRIELGKKLAWLLFSSYHFHEFYMFSKTVTHTGSRFDFEKFFPEKKKRQTPFLRTAYPAVSHYIDETKTDWFHGQKINKWFLSAEKQKKYEITDWYKEKQRQLHLFTLVEEFRER